MQDTEGNPLSGANISNKKRKVSVSTDAVGAFDISAEEGQILTISYVGFATMEIKMTNAKQIIVSFPALISFKVFLFTIKIIQFKM